MSRAIKARTDTSAVLSSLGAARHINAAQLAAGEKMRRTFLQATSGRFLKPRPEIVTAAMIDLGRAYRALGVDGYTLLQDVLAKDMSLARVAKARGITGRADREFPGKWFRACLDRLAVVYGYAKPGDEKSAAKSETECTTPVNLISASG